MERKKERRYTKAKRTAMLLALGDGEKIVGFQLSQEIIPCNSLANSALTCTPLSGFQFLIARRGFSTSA